MDYRRLKNVLIIKPSSLGDIIHALPVAAALKAAVPHVKIDWVAGAGYEELVEDNPSIRRIITFDRRMLSRGPSLSGLRMFIAELRREEYDLVIDLQGLLRSALMARACRAGARLGFVNAREGAPFFYTHKVKVDDTSIHSVDRYMLALWHIGITHAGDCEFHLNLRQEHYREARGVLSDIGIEEKEDFVVITPSARWVTKRWPAENFVELANRLLGESGIKSVFAGTDSDADIMYGADAKLIQDKYSAFGRTSIKGLAALLKMSRLLVTNDSGPMHLAAAVGTPVVAVFGPTDPKRTGPYGDIHTVMTSGMVCAPCFRKECEDVRCLADITPDEVYKRIKTLAQGEEDA